MVCNVRLNYAALYRRRRRRHQVEKEPDSKREIARCLKLAQLEVEVAGMYFLVLENSRLPCHWVVELFADISHHYGPVDPILDDILDTHRQSKPQVQYGAL